jgi:hypothetical protein
MNAACSTRASLKLIRLCGWIFVFHAGGWVCGMSGDPRSGAADLKGLLTLGLLRFVRKGLEGREAVATEIKIFAKQGFLFLP